jgi:eukaryotic translation initiation factor 2C
VQERNGANQFAKAIKEQSMVVPAAAPPSVGPAPAFQSTARILQPIQKMVAQKTHPGAEYWNPRASNQVTLGTDETKQISGRLILLNEKVKDIKYPARGAWTAPDSVVMTNHFEISFKDNPLYEYKIVPPLTGKRQKIKRLVESAIGGCQFLNNNRAYFATDYVDTIVAWKNLHELLQAPNHLRVQGGGGEGSEWNLITLVDGPNLLPLRFKFERVVDVTSLKQYTQTEPTLHAWNREPTVKALNIIFSKCFYQGPHQAVQLGANRFYLTGAHNPLTNGGNYATRSNSLCTIRGYFYTVRAGFDKVLLNVNTATGAFYLPQLVSQLMNDTWTWEHMDMEDVLKGLRVKILYDRGDINDKETYARLNSNESRTKTIGGLGESVRIQTFQPKIPGTQTLGLPVTVESHFLSSKIPRNEMFPASLIR